MAFGSGGHCPKCGARAPLRLLVWGTHKPFDCSGCGTSLIVANRVKLALFGLAGALAFFGGRDQQAGWQWNAGLFLAIFVLAGLASWLKMSVELADQN